MVELADAFEAVRVVFEVDEGIDVEDLRNVEHSPDPCQQHSSLLRVLEIAFHVFANLTAPEQHQVDENIQNESNREHNDLVLILLVFEPVQLPEQAEHRDHAENARGHAHQDEERVDCDG